MFYSARLSLLSTIYKRIFVIQASSAESRRHFFADGMIVSERRNLLSGQSDELLVILREAFINGYNSHRASLCNLSSLCEIHHGRYR